MADLWRMAQGRLQAQRSLVLAQAGLVWSVGKMTPENVSEFIQRGELRFDGDERQREKLPYDGKLLKSLIHGRAR